jgi:hypothetical protein
MRHSPAFCCLKAPIMLTDRYELPLSTASSDARNAYVQGCEAKLSMYPGAIEAFDRAIAADPAFALAHTAKAHALLERGESRPRARRWRRQIPSPPVYLSGK